MRLRAGLALLSGGLLLVTAAAAEPTLELRVLDAQGRTLDPRQSSASFSRTLPAELGGFPGPDEDARSFLLLGAPDTTLGALEVLSLSAEGRPIDVIVSLGTEPATCPEGVAPELVCRQTAPLRLVADDLERQHPALKRRSLRAVLGGKIRLSVGGKALVALPIGGPRGAAGQASGRWRAKLRVLVLRAQNGGPPAVGGTEQGARQVMANELAAASAIWAQCGVELGASVDVVTAPRSQLASVGCGLGQPASGGWLRLQNGPRQVALETHPGESPVAVALRLASALGGRGRAPQVFQNQRAAGDPLPSADLLLDAGGKWQPPAGALLSSDATLPLCLGQLDLSDGLSHFSDGDAFSGTFEERALLRAFDDGDPRSIELLVIPGFDGGERIGESFIVSPGSSLSSSVIIDRSAIAAGARSFALAHELGHVLLAMPGHPDDFGVDQSWSLMDADVADPTLFGPRRLSLSDCQRAITQSGPTALTPLLVPVPYPPK